MTKGILMLSFQEKCWLGVFIRIGMDIFQGSKEESGMKRISITQ